MIGATTIRTTIRTTIPTSSPEEESYSTNFFDARAYGFDETEPVESSPLCWSLDDADDGLRDWKISVSLCNGGENNEEGPVTTTYYVHKAVLAASRNRSDYFVRLFQSKNNVLQEFTTSTTTLQLEKSACEAFPAMLDFLYSHDGTAAIHTTNAVALRHLAHYFGIRNLFIKTTQFIQKDLNDSTSEAAPLYLSEATCYHDNRLANAAADYCASEVDNIDPSDFVVLSPDLVSKVFQSEKLRGRSSSSTHLSRIAAVYLEAHQDEIIDENVFQTMTNEIILDQICPNAAISLLKSLVEFQCNKDSNISKEWQRSLQKRCKQSLSQAWQDVIVKSVSVVHGQAIKPTSREGIGLVSHRVLPQAQQIEVLEDSILQANNDFEKMQNTYDEGLKQMRALYETRIRNLEKKLNAKVKLGAGKYVPYQLRLELKHEHYI